MLTLLRNGRGEPSLRSRLAAVLIVVGLLIAAAPLVVLPLLHALLG